MKRNTAIVALAMIAFAAFSPAVAEEEATPSLYDRLGGVYSIAAVVDDFIERVLVNETLNANQAVDHARSVVPKAGLKYRVTEMVCQVTGGPCVYTGRSMLDAHAHLNITEKEWDAMVEDFVASLNHFKVPEKEQKELLALVGTTKGDIVVPAGD